MAKSYLMRVRSRFRKRDVQAWADEHLRGGWRVQRNDMLDGWELRNPGTATYVDWQIVKEIVECAKPARTSGGKGQ